MKAYLAFVVAAVAAALAPAAASAAGQDPGARLGLPSIERAQQYNLSPASRELRPKAVGSAPAVNADYVTAANATSEQDAHDLDADATSQRVKVGGVMVRQAGPDEPRAQFAYRMQAPGKSAVTLRIEEAGAEHASYDVLVDGTVIHHRGDAPEQRGSYGGQVGLVHYDVAVPRSAIRGDEFRLQFRNGADPGPGARIAGVWVQSTGGTPEDPYGGTTQNAQALTGAKGAATLSGNLFGRPYAILDFGREVGGTLDVQAERLSGNPNLAFAFSESEQFMTSASDFSADPVGVVDETQVVPVHPLPEGTTRVNLPQLRGGFRYLMVYLDGPGAVKLSDLRLHFTSAPQEQDLRAYKGAFLSSAADLNELWYAGAYTVQMSTIDPSTGRRYPAQPGPAYNDAKVADGPSAIVDAPKRDRFVWGGDLAVSDPVAYMTTGDTESAENAFEWLAQKPSPEGQPAGVYLPLDNGTGWNYGWGEYAAWWIVNYQTHHLYTGDKAFLDRWFPQLEGAVGWFESHIGADGLLDVPGNAGGHWGYGNSGKEGYDNVLYVYALERAARAAEAMGRDDLAGEWRAHADRTAAAVNDQLWDADAGAYRTGPGAATHPQDANAMAVLAGVATGDRADAVLRFLDGLVGPYGPLTVDRPGGPVPQYVSPFVSSFQLDALAGKADDEAAVALLRRTWSRMLHGDTTGTFWENVSTAGGPQLGSYTSYSHGWAAAPTSYLTNQVLGVQPTGAGFSSFAVLPHPGTSTDWAQGTVPTPRGAVKAAWRRKGSAFSLAAEGPPGATYTAGVPERPGIVVTRDGQVVWSDGKPQASGVSSRGGYVQVEGLAGATRLDAEEGSR